MPRRNYQDDTCALSACAIVAIVGMLLVVMVFAASFGYLLAVLDGI
jgi:hypothetical protein